MPTGHIAHGDKPGQKILQAHPYHARKVQTRVPAVFEAGSETSRHRAEIQPVFVFLHAVHVVELRLHGEVRELDQLAVSLYHNIIDAGFVAREKRADVGVEIHAPSVNFIKLVSDLQAVGSL